jgi:hypothetical protein
VAHFCQSFRVESDHGADEASASWIRVFSDYNPENDMRARISCLCGLASLFAAGLITAATPPGPALPRPDQVRAIQRYAHQMRTAEILPRLRLLERARAKAPKELTTYDVLSADNRTTLDLEAGRVVTTTDIAIRSTQSGLDAVAFWLTPMDAFAVTDGTHALDYTASGQGYVTVTLAASLDAGQEVTLTFSDEGAPDCSPGFFGMQFCNIDPTITYFGGCSWVPTRVSYDYEDSMDAYPLTFALTFPESYESASPGTRTGAVNNGDGTVTHTYLMDGKWGIDFAIAQFDVATATSGSGATARIYTMPGHTDQAQAWADTDADVIDFYVARYADYPMDKIDAIQVLNELGGGFATPSAVFIYEDAFDYDPASDATSESIFAHEIAHQWWGFIVPLAEVGDPYSPWLNEGFAEFSAYTFSADIWGDYYIDYTQGYYADLIQDTIPADEQQPLSGMNTGSLDDNAYFLLTYEKGAYFLRMLRLVLGDEAFYAGMRAFAEGPGALGATTDGFQAVMEESSGQDLSTFFDQWAWGTQYPYYEYAFAVTGDDASGYTTTVRVTQMTDTPFVMSVPIVLYTGETDEETHVEAIDQMEQTFTYQSAAAVRGVHLDPRALVLGRRAPALHGDLNGSNDVDGLDLMYLAYAYRSDITSDNYQDAYNWIGVCDLNFDGKVDEADLQMLTDNFGKEGGL